ncbi:hypothetical protein M2447_002037 [Ereboglobus sp. PH5-10]|uniref:hypothetical protein n=1 Tax=Ereboglobus sp. PH5-10 TaxID=2940629 RepID=UPI002405EF2A|nr:hypothetical protein [Ereboglobus sp. PH5-10]MDF9827932.1 hypothetical protein [Ereboglobus sp. PH5-10]
MSASHGSNFETKQNPAKNTSAAEAVPFASNENTPRIAIPADALAAKAARLTGETRGFFLVKEFAAAIGRSHQFVSDRCRAKVIQTMRGGKPYRIPFAEYEVWLNRRTDTTKPKPWWVK